METRIASSFPLVQFAGVIQSLTIVDWFSQVSTAVDA
jgi:hypothetical protein